MRSLDIQSLKGLGKRVLSKNLFLPCVRGRRYIILFHDVSDPAAPHHNTDLTLGLWPYSYTTADFLKLVQLLERVFELVSLNEIVSETPGGKKNNFASIAFDDGFSSVLETAWPILHSRGIPFSVFINKNAALHNRLLSSTRVLFRKALKSGDERLMQKLYPRLCSQPAQTYAAFCLNPLRYLNEATVLLDEEILSSLPGSEHKIYLNEDDIRFLFQHGVIIGSHTVSHPMLSECGEPQIRREIMDNKAYLSALLNAQIDHFAIPFGGKSTFTEVAVDICREAGHRYIYSTNPTSFSFQDIARNRGLLPRYCIYRPDPYEFMFYINRPFLLSSNQ